MRAWRSTVAFLAMVSGFAAGAAGEAADSAAEALLRLRLQCTARLS